MSEDQFGFRRKHSTVDQLILNYNDITRAVDDGEMVDLIFFDFSKAFDKVCHLLLLLKLSNIGINPQLIKWIESFLVDRTMQVRVHGAYSRVHEVSSGVPQGSVLGPVLFLIYVNHVVSNISCQYKIFADDIKLYLSTDPKNPLAGETRLQTDIDTLVATSASWGLTMNTDKCICLRFGPKSMPNCSEGPSPYKINGIFIPFEKSHSDLGITVSRNLKFHDHINRTANTCNGIATNMISSTLCRESKFLMPIFLSFIRPKLEYGSCLWNTEYLGDTDVLERVQRKWTKKIAGLEDLPYEERLKRLDLFSVQGRLLRADMILVWKIFNNVCSLKPLQLFELDLSGRRGHSRKLFVPRVNLEVRKRSFASRVVHTWNSLSEEAISADTIHKFKGFLHRDLGAKLFNFRN